MSCLLKHIPERLHTKDKPTVNEFEVGNELYRRCGKSELENPFHTISIVDVSVNRAEILGDKISEKEDVLFNIVDCNPERYNQEVCVLRIRDLDKKRKYDKTFPVQNKNGISYIARLTLVHSPEKCMYPHCAFRVFLNGQEINDFGLYKATIDTLKQIKTALKHELASMIVQKEISQSR